MRLTAQLLQDLGFLLYAGPMLAFTVLVWHSLRDAGLPTLAAVRTFRAWGPGLGISLGACILGTVLGHWADHGAFTLALSSPAAHLQAAVYGVFLLAWISNIQLEVWTLEPLRKLDPTGPEDAGDVASYASAARRLSTHMGVHSLILLTVSVLEITRRAT
jgi:hypothetical protein